MSINRIGGTTDAARNFIQTNQGDGVHIEGQDASGNRVQGNRILQDGGDAVRDKDAPDNIIGEDQPLTAPKAACTGACNQISSKKNGVHIEASLAKGIRIHGNFFGESGTQGEFQAGIFSEGGNQLSASGNVLTNIGGIAVRLDAKASGNYDFLHHRITGKAELAGKFTMAEGLDVTVSLMDNFVRDARMGFQGEESIRGKFNWNVLKNNVEVKETAARWVFKGDGFKNFESGEWKATGGTVFEFDALIAEGVRASAKFGGEFSGSSMDGLVGRAEVRGELGYNLLNLISHDNGLNGARLDFFVGAGAKATVTASDVDTFLNASAGIQIRNGSTSLNLVEVFYDESRSKGNGIGVAIGGEIKFKNRDNVIADNREAGMVLSGNVDATIAGDIISGNGIGVQVEDTAKATLADNILTGNDLALVLAGTGTGMAISRNSIFANASLGIDLGNNGVTPNDLGDGDTGPNNLQNFPVLTSATSNDGATTILGLLNSTPNTVFTLEFFANSECDPSGFGEGETFIGSTKVTTDGSGNASFTAIFQGTAGFITATATDLDGNTSEFSRCISVQGGAVNQPPVANAGPDRTVGATSPAGALVTLNGTGSSDPDGDPLSFTWAGPFGTATGPTPTVTIPRGTHTITLTVTDPHGASATDTVSVTVRSPSQMVSNLIVTVTNLNFRQGIHLLENALRQINAGNTRAACNQLKAFTNQVRAQSGKKLTAAQANQLIAAANQIRAALGCG